MSGKLTLILGGARSGKSSYAQSIAEQQAGVVLYVATATAGDAEMAQRIASHRSSRPPGWFTLEAPLNVGKAIRTCSFKPDFVLLDCLTLLANNLLAGLPEPVGEAAYQAAIQAELDELLQAWQTGSADWAIVSNEVGLGIVPAYPLGRVYRDVLGKANQRLAQAATRVLFMVAGLPMVVKG
jgi:adenosylcobinamide kinase / adenosylcobinamide-phosphate guanylyltransferase